MKVTAGSRYRRLSPGNYTPEIKARVVRSTLQKTPARMSALSSRAPGATIELNPDGGLQLLVLEGGFSEGGETYCRTPGCGCPSASTFSARVGIEGCRVWVKVSRSRQFDGREIEIIDGLPDWSYRISIEAAGTGTGKPDDRRGDERAPLPRMVVFRSDTASVPSCSRPSRTSPRWPRKARPSSTATRHDGAVRLPIGRKIARRGRNKRMGAKAAVPRFCHHDREGHHQFSWHKNQEQSQDFPSDTVVMLQAPSELSACPRGPTRLLWLTISLTVPTRPYRTS